MRKPAKFNWSRIFFQNLRTLKKLLKFRALILASPLKNELFFCLSAESAENKKSFLINKNLTPPRLERRIFSKNRSTLRKQLFSEHPRVLCRSHDSAARAFSKSRATSRQRKILLFPAIPSFLVLSLLFSILGSRQSAHSLPTCRCVSLNFQSHDLLEKSFFQTRSAPGSSERTFKANHSARTKNRHIFTWGKTFYSINFHKRPMLRRGAPVRGGTSESALTHGIRVEDPIMRFSLSLSLSFFYN